MKTTTDFFQLDVNALLETNEYGYTKEENLLFDSGLKVVFFDDLGEMESELIDFNAYIKERSFEIKEVLKTINDRIAVILI